MKNFVTYNALGIFSLIILCIVFYQANNYLESDNTKLKKIWLSAISTTFVVQLLDIICWYFTSIPGKSHGVLNYIGHLVLFNFILIMSCRFALFIDYSIRFSDKIYKSMKRKFNVFILICVTLSLISIPFNILLKLEYSEVFEVGGLLFTAILSFMPLFVVMLRVILNENKSIKALLLTGIIFPLMFVILQITNISPIPLIFPSVTTFILIMNSLLTINSMYTDHLTGLKNTRGVDRYFAKLPQSINSYLTAIFIDINDFKLTNDKYGHKEGDIELCAFSKILSRNLKSEDLAARIGGDEFLIVTKLSNPSNVNMIINGIKNDIANYNENSLKPYKLSISYGVNSTLPDAIINKDQLIAVADREMYRQKSNKRQLVDKEAL